MKAKLWWVIVPVIASGLIAWGAWATVGVTGGTPREIFDEHVQHAQERIEDKLDDIQKTILELHKED